MQVGVQRPCGAVVLASFIAGCASSGGTVTVPGSDRTIPRAALNALEDRWDDVVLGRGHSAPCAKDATAMPVALGDFNGDDLMDIALWMTADGTPRLVVLFSRVHGEYVVVEVGTSETLVGELLEVIPKGQLVRTPVHAFDPYLGLDTVAVRQCGGARTAWRWTGATFTSQPLVD